jgi:hypothetical protein
MAFEFFRKHQRAIIYTAGIFTLLTFSITGSVLGFADTLFGKGYEGPSLQLADGRTVQLQLDDVEIGRRLARGMFGTAVVLPPVDPGEGSNPDDVYAALRRLAVDSGIQVSEIEIDRAIEQAIEISGQVGEELTPTQLALRAGNDSLEAFRNVVREALRVGLFMRLQALGVDVSDAALADYVLEGQELVTFEVAALDKKILEEELKKTPPSDEELAKWIDTQVADKDAHPYRETTNRVALRAVGLAYTGFDPAAHTALLEGTSFDDAALQREYEARKEVHFKREAKPPKDGQDGDKKEEGEPKDPEHGAETQTPPEDPWLPFADVQERVRGMLQAEAVLQKIAAGDLQMRLAAHVREQVEARNTAAAALHETRVALQKSEQELAAAADDEAKKAAVETAKQAVEAAQAARKSADEALRARRLEFDLTAALKAILGESTPLVVEVVAQAKTGEELRELGAFGAWNDNFVATSTEEPGTLSTTVQKARNGAFLFQITDVVKRPLKPMEAIKEQALADYYKSKADEQGKEKTEAFKTALLDAAKRSIQEKVDELEKKKATELEEQFGKWRAGLEKELAEARKVYDANSTRPDSLIAQRYKAKIDKIEAQLAKADDKRKELEKAIGERIDGEIAAAARKVYPDVLAQIAPAQGFEIRVIGPHPRTLSREPRFDNRYDDTVKFLFRDAAMQPPLAEIEAGDVTDVLDDQTGRATYLVICRSVDKSDPARLTRRMLESRREEFIRSRYQDALIQSFTLDALRERHRYKQAPGEHEELVGEAPPETPGGK